jgi:hypothetical protein
MLTKPLTADQIINILVKNNWSINYPETLDLIEFAKEIEKAHGIEDHKKEALENIEQEIIARACRNGVCED